MNEVDRQIVPQQSSEMTMTGNPTVSVMSIDIGQMLLLFMVIMMMGGMMKFMQDPMGYTKKAIGVTGRVAMSAGEGVAAGASKGKAGAIWGGVAGAAKGIYSEATRRPEEEEEYPYYY